MKIHTNVKHNGIRDNLREEVWISERRNFEKVIVNNCSVCRKFEGPGYDYPKVGPLHDVRVNFDFLYYSKLFFHILRGFPS